MAFALALAKTTYKHRQQFLRHFFGGCRDFKQIFPKKSHYVFFYHHAFSKHCIGEKVKVLGNELLLINIEWGDILNDNIIELPILKNIQFDILPQEPRR